MLISHFVSSFYNYFISIFANTDLQLLLLLLCILLTIVVIRILDMRKIIYFRHQVNLIMGSWGTRGKSSTERLKAAVFYGHGFNLLAKSSGSEPNLLFGSYVAGLKEVVLYRPYDYANIKEQIKILRRAIKLKPSVFQWECMAINPQYAAVLQKWMQDDLTTILNAYPDHENIQGPRGIDTATSLAEVIPHNGILLSTEESMLPVFDNKCRQNHTRLVAVGACEAALITEDVFHAFAHTIYYKNLALVIKLFTLLGLNQQEVLTHVKNHIVPDIGSFHIHNPAHHDGRTLRFVNCMSANDNYSTQVSLEALQYKSMTLKKHPERWLILCVNNRYDRINRSYSFSQALTHTLQADIYLLMGTNVHAFMSIIRQYWRIKMKHFFILKVLTTTEQIKEEYQTLVEWLRIPTTKVQFLTRFGKSLSRLLSKTVTLESLQDDMNNVSFLKQVNIEHGDALIKLVLRQYAVLCEYQASMHFFENTLSKSALRNILIRYLTKWYFDKYVLITNHRVNGDEINSIAFANTPLELDGYFICVANIKGPGLALSHSWLLRDRIELMCNSLLSHDINTQDEAFAFLLKQPFFNTISSPCVGKTVRTLLQQSSLDEQFREKLLQLEQILIASRMDKMFKKRKMWRYKVILALLQQVENFLEPGASITRKKQADLIYAQLMNHFISTDEAKKQLNRLLMKQKGGWLARIFMRGSLN